VAVITTDMITKLFAGARTGLKSSGIDHMTLTKAGIDAPHYMIHQGVHFFDARSAVVGNAGVFFHIIKAPALGSSNVVAHLVWDVQYTLSCDVELYEDLTGADPTDTPLNSFRASTTVAEARCDEATTGYTAGTLLGKLLLGSATAAPRGVAANASRADEIILKPESIYAIKVTSNAANNRITTRMFWYEAGANVSGA